MNLYEAVVMWDKHNEVNHNCDRFVCPALRHKSLRNYLIAEGFDIGATVTRIYGQDLDGPNFRSDFPVKESPVEIPVVKNRWTRANLPKWNPFRDEEEHNAEWNGMGYNLPESNEKAPQSDEYNTQAPEDVEEDEFVRMASTLDAILVQLTRIADASEQRNRMARANAAARSGVAW